jgi:hypothetical protein
MDEEEFDDVAEMMEVIAAAARSHYIRPMFELIDDLASSQKALSRWPIPFDGDEII